MNALKPGQIVTVNDIVAQTGLGNESVDTVLQALTRAELFTQLDPTTFVRESLVRTVTDDDEVRSPAAKRLGPH